MAPAGALLSELWRAQPPLISEFVSQKHLPTLLKRAAHTVGSTAQNCVVVLKLVQLVWSFTASLVSEPLLLQAIPGIVQCCGQVTDAQAGHLTAHDLRLQACLQVGCHMSHRLCYCCVSLSMQPLVLPLHSTSPAVSSALASDVTTAMCCCSVTTT